MVEWDLAELVVHPELMKRARQEIDDIVGSHRLVQESDIPKLPFLQVVVKETFRVRVPGPLGVPRESTAPVEALGYKIPSRTRIIYNLYAVRRDPDVYENPVVLDPDRFLRHHVRVKRLSAFDSYELISFGVGRRMCPGFNLRNTFVHFVLANLIHSYNWLVPEGGCPDMTESLQSIIVCLKKPLMLVPKLRDGISCFLSTCVTN